MSIASGFTKMKNYILTSSGYKLLSRWTSSQTVHMGDGTDDTDTVEYRFGAMKGITSSLATDNDEFALSASAGKNLQDQCTQLNQSLTNKTIYQGINYVITGNKNTIIIDMTGLAFTNGVVSSESFMLPSEFHPKKPKVVTCCAETDDNSHRVIVETNGQLYTYLSSGAGFTGQLSGQIVLNKNFS